MILEVAEVHVRPGSGPDFEQAVATSAERWIEPTQGYVGHELRRSVETPTRYLLLITWESVEAHVEHFRNGPHFDDHRALIGAHFAQPPHVEHFELA